MFLSIRKINKINREIEKYQEKLDIKIINNIEGNMEIIISNESKEEKQKIKKIKLQIEKLKREKTYILEKISIYKIFKR